VREDQVTRPSGVLDENDNHYAMPAGPPARQTAGAARCGQRADGADFAGNQVPPPSEAERGPVLRNC
jgi:hypothetical protein